MPVTRVYVGTSGFSYAEWKGSFYPKGLPASKMLRFYGEHFSTCEINATFYRMPKGAALTKWLPQVPESFVFGLKAPQRITHQERLQDSGESVTHFWKEAQALGGKLGPILFQLPPFLKKDVSRLADFLTILPVEMRSAFEFRHESWFTEEVFEVLRGRNAALCLAETDKNKWKTPLVATADWGYLRLREVDYDEKCLAGWAEHVLKQAWEAAYVYFKHEDEGTGPRLASRLGEMIGQLR